MKTTIAIVGRPNVGKSTLFNRLARKPKAIIDDLPGVTRDRNYAEIQWDGYSLILIDTGGFEFEPNHELSRLVQEQARLAIEEADGIIFLSDGQEGLTPVDQDLINLLRTIPKPIFHCINKIDGPRQEKNLYDFFATGIDRWFPISAKHNRGVNELMAEVVKILPREKPAVREEKPAIKIAVLGRPNVGKSSLVNRILGYNRVIVSETPGTTRDAIDSYFNFNGTDYIIIDTAGIRRKSRIGYQLEKYCVIAALKAISRCDIGLILIDAQEGVTEQDVKIAGQVYNQGKGCMVVVNKWDLIPKDTTTAIRYREAIKAKMKFLDFAPILFVSALSGQRVTKILDQVNYCFTQYQKRIETAELNQFLARLIQEHPPAHYRGKPIKFYYATQAAIKPPTFVFFTNFPTGIHFSYERYIINQLREAYGFEGTPLKIFFRGRKDSSK
jgi:GTP-binding protein